MRSYYCQPVGFTLAKPIPCFVVTAFTWVCYHKHRIGTGETPDTIEAQKHLPFGGENVLQVHCENVCFPMQCFWPTAKSAQSSRSVPDRRGPGRPAKTPKPSTLGRPVPGQRPRPAPVPSRGVAEHVAAGLGETASQTDWYVKR